MCLFEDDDVNGMYVEVYDVNCARYGREVDLSIMFFKVVFDFVILGEVMGIEEVLEFCLKVLMEIM